MQPWSVVKTWSCLNPPSDIIRQPCVQQQYNLFKQQLQQQNIDVNDYMAQQLFSQRNQKLAFLPNKFPYWVEPGVHHWVLWVNTPVYRVTVKDVEVLLTKVLRGHPFVFFQNLPENRTVLQLEHYHVFFK